MPDRRRRLLEYGLVGLTALAVATVLVVAVRAGRDGAEQQSPAAPASGTTTVSATSTTSTGPTGPAGSTVPPTVPPTGTRPTTGRPSGTVSTVPTMPAGLLGRDVEWIPTSRAVVALTFDAGANADGLASILATLRRERVPATFFLTATFARAFPAECAAITAAGHRVGNHSVDHPHFPALTDQAVRDQLATAEQTIRTVAGQHPRPLFRFPFGDRDQRTIRLVNEAGYVPVRWTVDTLGWQGTSGGRSADSVTATVLGAARAGEIVLMHVGSNPEDHTTLDADALPTAIARLRSAGYSFVTLDALFG